MTFYRITDDMYAAACWQLGEISSASGPVDAWRFTTGKLFENLSPLSVMCIQGDQLDFNMAHFEVPIVSSKAALILEDLAEADLQLSPVEILGLGSSGGKWFILNVISQMACIEERESVFTKWSAEDGRSEKTGKYRMVPKLRVKGTMLESKHLTRIENWKVPIIVSGVVKAKFEEASVTGAVFEPVT
ncbi:MAG: DUF1629 domain-containing protein [Fuerstiella sp.]